jgi:hypothetical protein
MTNAGNDQVRQRKRNAFPEQSGGQCTGGHPCGLSDLQIWECQEAILLVTLLMGSTSLEQLCQNDANYDHVVGIDQQVERLLFTGIGAVKERSPD